MTLTGLEALDAAPLEPDDAGATVVSLADVSEGQALRVGAGMPVDTRVAAAVASTTTAGDLRGLAAASCAAPDIDHWLVGGAPRSAAARSSCSRTPVVPLRP